MEVLEVFNSISGEVSPYHQGCLVTFVRFPKCNLKCNYCDTDVNGRVYDVSLKEISELYKKTGHLCITGGEPLIHREEVEELIRRYPNSWIETNGTYDFSDLIGKTSIVTDHKLSIVDYKIPDYFFKLSSKDFVKFVVAYEHEIDEAVKIQRVLELCGVKSKFAYSPLFSFMSAHKLTEYLTDIQIKAIVNIQIHKYINMK